MRTVSVVSNRWSLLGRLVLALVCSWSPFAASAAARAADQDTILVLGDSLSAAYGIAPQAGWVSLLAARLAADPATRSRKVLNASISGETTSGGLARFAPLLERHRPGLVLIELGANDALRGLPIAEIRANLTRLIEQSRAAGARVLLIGIEIPVNYGPQYRNTLRTVYRDLAAQFNVPLVPFLLEGVAMDEKLMQDDGLHPRAEAQPRILGNVWPVLGPMLVKKG